MYYLQLVHMLLSVRRYVDRGQLPHLLFHGPPGEKERTLSQHLFTFLVLLDIRLIVLVSSVHLSSRLVYKTVAWYETKPRPNPLPSMWCRTGWTACIEVTLGVEKTEMKTIRFSLFTPLGGRRNPALGAYPRSSSPHLICPLQELCWRVARYLCEVKKIG